MNIGRAIRQCRGITGINQQELARRSELSHNYVNGLENGRYNPTLDSLMRLSIGLGLPLWQILRLAESNGPETMREAINIAQRKAEGAK